MMEIDAASDSSPESDTADSEQINSQFPKCKHIHSQSLGPKYVLDISATRDSNPYIAAALSDGSCVVLNMTESQVAKVSQLNEHKDKLVGCKFSPRNNNLLYTASSDGTIKLWDLRESKKTAVTFLDTTINKSDPVKTLTTFDVSPCDRLLAGGTELIDCDSFILFWDVRKVALLGAYWESHTDEITQVKFNPEDTNRLMSGSTDGLINIFDLSHNSEDDALQECLNTEEHVEVLEWFQENRQWKISCITSTNDLQLWTNDGAEPYKRLKRDEVGEVIKKLGDNVYLAKTLPLDVGLLVLVGSNKNEGKTLRSFWIKNGKISSGFQFVENDQRVRASWVDEHANILLTGGEKGKLDVWRPDLKSCE